MSPPANLTAIVPRRHSLLRILGLGFGIAIGIGTTLGTGILRVPGEIAAALGSVQLTFVAWILGGLFTLLFSSTVSELATRVPRAGGWFVYTQAAFGRRPGFVVGCCDWTMLAVANAFGAIAIGEVAVELLPGLVGHETAVALIAMCVIALVNLVGLRSGGRTQTVTTVIKSVALVALVIGCLAVKGSPTPAGASQAVQHPALLIGWLLAAQAVVMSYDGWYAPMYFAEEVEDPVRNLPRSMFSTVIACVILFVLINAAVAQVLGIAQLQHSKIPVADAALSVFGSFGKQCFLLITAITLISTTNASVLTAPRVIYGLARDGLLPRSLSAVNQGGTPAWALLLCLVVSVALIVSGTILTMLAIISVLQVALYVSGFASLLMLRRREPHPPRTFRAWGHPWSTLALLLVSLAFLVGAILGDLKHSLFTVILVGLAYLASFAFMRELGKDAPQDA
jgi:basic amino acid/polyamine antiporter, APA family